MRIPDLSTMKVVARLSDVDDGRIAAGDRAVCTLDTYPELTFVDDKVNHLDSVASLGVRCALAAWGYNGRREHELAAEHGYLVCDLDNVEEKLF